jgi:hypothetical protein
MISLIKLLGTGFARRHRIQLDGHLACDIGISRIVLEYHGS